MIIFVMSLGVIKDPLSSPSVKAMIRKIISGYYYFFITRLSQASFIESYNLVFPPGFASSTSFMNTLKSSMKSHFFSTFELKQIS